MSLNPFAFEHLEIHSNFYFHITEAKEENNNQINIVHSNRISKK